MATAKRTLRSLMDSGQVTELPHPLSTDDKETWAREGRVFTLKHMTLGQDDSGVYYSYLIIWNGKEYTFRLNEDATRASMNNDLLKLLPDGPVEEMRLRALSHTKGNAYIVLDAAE